MDNNTYIILYHKWYCIWPDYIIKHIHSNDMIRFAVVGGYIVNAIESQILYCVHHYIF